MIDSVEVKRHLQQLRVDHLLDRSAEPAAEPANEEMDPSCDGRGEEKMDRCKLLLISWLIASSLSTAYGSDLMREYHYLPPEDASLHRRENATVFRVVSDSIFFKTEEGAVQGFF